MGSYKEESIRRKAVREGIIELSPNKARPKAKVDKPWFVVYPPRWGGYTWGIMGRYITEDIATRALTGGCSIVHRDIFNKFYKDQHHEVPPDQG